ncbi:hypothetical protein FGRMN_6916 [Fusarium graminum]|nr:hypothetical protein FGRMN_6916 [Fusarium graminum]
MAFNEGRSCDSLVVAENACFMAASADADDDPMDIDPPHASMQPFDSDTVSMAMDLDTVLSSVVDTVSSSVVDPVLDNVALDAEMRVNLYKECIKFDSRNLIPDSQDRFLCPVGATGLVSYFDNDLTRSIGWHQEYLVEVLKSVVFVFTTSDSMRLFSAFIHSHFHLEISALSYNELNLMDIPTDGEMRRFASQTMFKSINDTKLDPQSSLVQGSFTTTLPTTGSLPLSDATSTFSPGSPMNHIPLSNFLGNLSTNTKLDPNSNTNLSLPVARLPADHVVPGFCYELPD